MSTSMQHNNRLWRHVRNVLQHGIKVQLAAVSLVVAVLLDVEASVAADGVVVAPRGVGQGNVLVGVELGQVFSTYAKSTGTRNGLSVGVPAIGNHIASVSKSQLSSLSSESSVANNWQILLVQISSKNLLLSRPDGRQDPRLALVIAVSADAQVHLVGVLALFVGFSDADDGVGGSHGDAGPVGGRSHRALDGLFGEVHHGCRQGSFLKLGVIPQLLLCVCKLWVE